MMNGRTGTRLSHTLAKNHHQKFPGCINFPFRLTAKNGADCYSKNGYAVTVLTWQS